LFSRVQELHLSSKVVVCSRPTDISSPVPLDFYVTNLLFGKVPQAYNRPDRCGSSILRDPAWLDFIDDTVCADHPSAADCTSSNPARCRLELIAYLTDTQTELVHVSLSCRGAAAAVATRYHLCLIFSTKGYPWYPRYDLKETDSKIEQGNDSFNSVRRQRQLHSNWALLNISRPYMTRDAAAIAAAAVAAVRDSRG